MSPRVIIVFLAGTATLLVAALFYTGQPPRTAVKSAEPGVPGAAPQKSAGVAEKSVSGKPPPAGFSWSQIETADYKQYIANLRAIGCPEETIREIIITDVNKLYAPKEAPFKSAATVPLPWDGPGTVNYSSLSEGERRADSQKKRQLREVQLEKRALLKELLNIETPLETVRGWHTRNYEMFESAFNTLPESKREMVRQIQENYWQVSDTIADRYNDQRPPEFLEEYKRNNAERRAQLEKVLSPQELDEYELRTSSVANRLASQLSQFNPTPEEFQAIAKIKLAIEQPFGGALTADSAEAGTGQASGQRQNEVNEKIRQLLGEERFAEYQRSQDSNYRRLTDLADRYGLPKDSALKAYEIQQAANDRMQKLGMDATLSKEERNAAFRSAQAETAQNLTAVLGEKAYNAFSRRNRGGPVNIDVNTDGFVP